MSADPGFSNALGDQGRPAHEVMENAAQWYALLISGEASAADQARWQAWLASHPHHRLAWRYVESVSQRVLAPLRSTPDPQLMAAKVSAVHTRVRSRRRVLAGLAAMAGTGMLGWAGWSYPPIADIVTAWGADYRTGTGDIREFRLADGSQVWLNAASALNAEMRADLRRLTLVAGEILVATAPVDPRPFVVETPQGSMRALGTRFTVRREPGHTFLAVYEGAVEIRPAGPASARIIAAGQQTRFDADRVMPVESADAAREAWSRGELLAWDLSLADVVDELGRYHAGHISVAPDVAQRRVFGTFPLRDVDGTLAMLAEVASVQLRRPLPWWISIEGPAAREPARP